MRLLQTNIQQEKQYQTSEHQSSTISLKKQEDPREFNRFYNNLYQSEQEYRLFNKFNQDDNQLSSFHGQNDDSFKDEYSNHLWKGSQNNNMHHKWNQNQQNLGSIQIVKQRNNFVKDVEDEEIENQKYSRQVSQPQIISNSLKMKKQQFLKVKSNFEKLQIPSIIRSKDNMNLYDNHDNNWIQKLKSEIQSGAQISKKSGQSPATATSGTSAGKKSNKSLQRKNLMKNRTKLNPKLFKDTNSIYPLNKQYKDNELKSPYKQRPLSGGPSPDKFKIEYEKGPKYKYGEQSIFTNDIQDKFQKDQKFMENCQKIFRDHQETQKMLSKAQDGIQQTRVQIQQSILQTQDSVNYYKGALQEMQQNIEQKMQEKLKNNYVLQQEQNIDSKEPKQDNKKLRFFNKTNRKNEYKYAFGQKIPVNYEWFVKQPIKDNKENKSNQKVQKNMFHIVYDFHGRPQRYIINNNKQQSEQANANIIKQNSSQQSIQNNIESTKKDDSEQQQQNNENENYLPEWIRNPFGQLNTNATPKQNSDKDEDENQVEEKQEFNYGQEVQKNGYQKKKQKTQKRIQKDLIIRSKSRGTSIPLSTIKASNQQLQLKNQIVKEDKNQTEYKKDTGVTIEPIKNQNRSANCKINNFQNLDTFKKSIKNQDKKKEVESNNMNSEKNYLSQQNLNDPQIILPLKRMTISPINDSTNFKFKINQQGRIQNQDILHVNNKDEQETLKAESLENSSDIFK